MNKRASYLSVSQQFTLNAVCKTLRICGWHVYQVGSSLERPDYRDVDLRAILDDGEFDYMIGDQWSTKHRMLNTAMSDYLAARTGLPIDFQFQRKTEANAEHQGQRNAVGIL